MTLQDQIKDVVENTIRVEEIEEWGFALGIRLLPLRARGHLMTKLKEIGKGRFPTEEDVQHLDYAALEDWNLQLLVECLVDPESKQLVFVDVEAGKDILRERAGAVVDRLVKAAVLHNKLNRGAVEDAVKN